MTDRVERQLSGCRDNNDLIAEALALAAAIILAWRETLEGIFKTGDLLIKAKAIVPKGQWLEYVQEHLPFKAATARRLIKIASDKRLRQELYATHLPVCWYTLWQLAKLTDEQFERGLQSGKINPDMLRVDIEVLKGSWVWAESSLPRMASSTSSYKRAPAKPDPRTKARMTYFERTIELTSDEAAWELALCDAHFRQFGDDDDDEDDDSGN